MNRPPYMYGTKRKSKGNLLLNNQKPKRRAKRVLDEVRSVEKEALGKAMSILDEVDKLDGRLSHVWHLWEHRMDRLFVPHFAAHAKNMFDVICCVLQVLMILKFVHVSDGNIGDVKEFGVIMLPIYAAILFRLTCQFLALLHVLRRAIYEENPRSVVFSNYRELDRFSPVLEQILPVATYILLFVTAISIGSCHLNFSPDRVPEGLCKTFTLDVVRVIVGIYMSVQIIHHLLSVYNHSHHTSLPRRKWTTTAKRRRYDDGEDEELGGDSVVDNICMLNEEVTSIWSWWKFRMNKIFTANVTQNLCNMFDISLEGVTTLLVIKEVHNSHGNLANISNMPKLLVPLYVKFFTKALIQAGVLIYVFCTHFTNDDELQFIRFLREPGHIQKTLEHTIPMFAQILFGCVAVAIGQCHLNPTLQNGQTICKIFNYEVVFHILWAMGLLQLCHHIVSIFNFTSHKKKPKRKNQYNMDEIELSSVSNAVI